MKIAILSDIHANAFAMRETLAMAETKGFDRLIILGDLLTYGCSPREVISLVGDAVARHGAHIVAGNHDQLYFDLAAGRTQYYSALPAWLRESVDWTMNAIAGIELENLFDWKRDIAVAGAYFSHANTYPYGDWRYLNSADDFVAAREALRNDIHIGVFGHTHRAKVARFVGRDPPRCVLLDTSGNQGEKLRFTHGDAPILATVGSVGQPRSADKSSSMMFLTIDDQGFEIDMENIFYNIGEHCRAILESNISEQTKQKLVSYFR